MLRPAGNPLLDTAYHLFAELRIFGCARRVRRKRKNGLFICRRLFKSYTSGYDSIKKFSTKNATNLFVNFTCQRRSLIVQRHQNTKHLQVWIWTRLYPLNSFKEIV